jgi:hypothetical protein
MGLSDIVNLQITLRSGAPTRAGFGRALIVGALSAAVISDGFPERSRLYKQANDMLSDAFTTKDALYRLALAHTSQRPRPKDFKIGRAALAPTQIVNLTPTSTTEGFVYTLTFASVVGIADTTVTYTVAALATIATICTGLSAAIEASAIGGAVAATGVSGTHVAVTTGTAGAIIEYKDVSPELSIADVTTDPGIATDLGAIYAADSDWFGLLLASNSEAEIAAAAAWIEDKRRMLCYVSADNAIKTGSASDIASDLKALAYFNTGGFYHPNVGSTLAACVMGQRLTTQPGSDTWAHKTITGERAATALELTAAQEAFVYGKNCNTYTDIGGSGRVLWGKVASGEYFDQTRYIHFLYARIQEAVLSVFQNVEKVPYTNEGIALITGAVQGVLFAHTKNPFNALTKDPAPFVEAPLASEVDLADKAERLLPDVTFSAQLTGAIHAVNISGTVSI